MQDDRVVSSTGGHIQAIRHMPDLEKAATHMLAVEPHDLGNGHQECLTPRDWDHYRVHLPSRTTEICESTDLEQFTVAEVYIHEPGVGHTRRPR